MSAENMVLITEKGVKIFEAPQGVVITAVTNYNNTLYFALHFKSENGRSEIWQINLEEVKT